MKNPVFVTTVYGERYGAFLTPHLASIERTHPGAEGIVISQDLSERERAILKLAYPRWRFVESDTPMGGSLHQRIPRKLHAWLQGALVAGDRPLALLDCDTLVLRSLIDAFEGPWDVAYTWKNEPFPLNTGVMLATDARAMVPLLREMVRRVEAIVERKDRLGQACGASGAADQHALRELIGFVNYDRDVTIELEGRPIVCRGLRCAEFNETNCVPVTEDRRILHYKAGWHPILLDGADYTENRPRERCREMLRLWRAFARESHREMARSLVFRGANAALGAYRPLADGYEERGVLHSEMLAACGIVDALGVRTVLESGRARGQSTLQLARYLEGSGRSLVSLEMSRDDDAIFAERRLAGHARCELRYGDAFESLADAITELGDSPAALLIDGPKGLPAIELIGDLFERFANLRAAFLHDTRRQTPQRELLENSGVRAFFTDDDEYVERFGVLDEACKPAPGQEITMHTWRPFRKGKDAIPSYGPTLAVLLPTPNVSLASDASLAALSAQEV